MSNIFFREYHALIPQHLQRTRQGLCFEGGVSIEEGGCSYSEGGGAIRLFQASAFEPLDPFCSSLVRACLPPEEASNLTWGLTRWQSGALSSPNKTSSSKRGEESPSEECCKVNTRITKTQAPITNHDPQNHQHEWSKLINCSNTE